MDDLLSLDASGDFRWERLVSLEIQRVKRMAGPRVGDSVGDIPWTR